MPSTRQTQHKSLHVAIIMDGNGRWAKARGLPREAGHHAGVAALREVTEAAAHRGIGTLTVYAFSVDNWRRPPAEVAALMALLSSYLENELARLVKAGVRFTAIGRRDRLGESIVALIRHAEAVTAGCRGLNLRVALDYSGRDAILAAASACQSSALTREAMSEELAAAAGGPDVDLLIRTSGEQRLSDFLVWEAAYAELYFTDTLWPDFGSEDLDFALAAFAARDRRFGGLTAPEAVTLPASHETKRPVVERARAFFGIGA
jgi:undecaprenyl diphosphate synthase